LGASVTSADAPNRVFDASVHRSEACKVAGEIHLAGQQQQIIRFDYSG
jgi:hypothetical protein